MIEKPERIDSLDVFRGLAILGMLFADFPGSWEHMAAPFQHAWWNGWTQTDLVFPFFLFIMGFSMTLSLDARLARGDNRKRILSKILKRTFWLFFIGLAINVLYTDPFPSLGNLRIPGVLQRIAVVYLAVALMHLHCHRRTMIWTGVTLLVGYWLAMTLIPVPGFGKPDLGMYPEGVASNLAAWIDMKVLGNHAWIWSQPFDPEGILSTLPSILTALIGVLAGRWFKKKGEEKERVIGFFIAGFVLITLAQLWQYVYPINKKIWSGSFVILTGGLALFAFAFLYHIIDVKGKKGWIKPLQFFGTNAIAVYIATYVSDAILYLIPAGGMALKDWLYQTFYASWLSPVMASHAYTVVFVAFWMAGVYGLYRRGIFFKI